MSDGDSVSLNDYIQSISDKHPTKLKLAHINAQSLLNDSKFSEFSDLFTNSGIDVIFVSETWLKDNIQVSLPGYNSFYVNRVHKTGGGVGVFVKSCFMASVISKSQGESDRPEFILLEVRLGSDKILVAGVYRPPKVGFLDVFQEQIYKHTVNYKYTFVCGDFNARFGSGTDETKIISETLDFCNLHCVPFGPTFHILGCESVLDVISSNCPEFLIEYGQKMATGFSAHDFLYAVYDLAVARIREKPITYRDFKNIVQEELLNDVQSSSWDSVYTSNDIDTKLDRFNSIVNMLMEKHAPEKTFVPKKFKQPWMTKEIRTLMRKRDRLRAKYLNKGGEGNKECFRAARNNVHQKIRSAKSRYFYEKLDLSGNTKTTWSILRSLNINSTAQQVDLTVSVDDLNRHYASVSSVKNPELISTTIGEYVMLTEDKDVNNSFHFRYVLPEQIIEAVTSITSNAKGVDLIPIRFIKLCLPALLPVLDHIFNFSLQNSCFPTLWKKANILPIPKVKHPMEPKDYRPVSLLCVLGKVLEKVVHKQVCDYLNEHSLFSKYQSGYRPNHSTVTALLKVADDIRAAMDKRLLTLLVMIDLSKAFDCVHHDLLLTKLKFLGFSNAATAWFSSYLYDRCHRVFISPDQFSAWAEIGAGVPQGSVLGPLLFLIYMFDLPKVITHCSHHSYADDLQLYKHCPISGYHVHLKNVQEDAQRIINFCASHNLVPNVVKTKVIIFGTQRYLTDLNNSGIPQFTINDCVIPYSNVVNNLGVMFDSTLSWIDHCVMVAQKVFSIIAQLRRNFCFIPLNIRKLLMTTLVFPHIDYASVLFTDMSAVNNLKLQRLQNACVRFITGAKVFEHITPYYKELKVLKVAERRMLAVALLTWKIFKFKQPSYLYESYSFTSTSNVRSTRSNKLMLQMPNHRLEKFHNSFHIKSIKCWNDFHLYLFLDKSPGFVKNYILNILYDAV
jgi:hypothetical protein